MVFTLHTLIKIPYHNFIITSKDISLLSLSGIYTPPHIIIYVIHIYNLMLMLSDFVAQIIDGRYVIVTPNLPCFCLQIVRDMSFNEFFISI